ncbi:uncharacterized protein EAF01_005268 [Botrytis porri]|uniref:uncharacterized protein n=1 Tax=Botrytis porri TaxID=87229 RepID=UPI001900061E|nr:uncharacterized protein EAF01_005268 [Botrytis porri]KAF7907682.1 hypothetical protein EAF01_005268 [Botrytis porri]
MKHFKYSMNSLSQYNPTSFSSTATPQTSLSASLVPTSTAEPPHIPRRAYIRSAGPKSITLQSYLPFSHRYLDDFCVGPLTAPPMSPPHEER